MGDLSGKFGSLDNQTIYKTYYNDTLLTLFGPRSVLGRSLVIHKKVCQFCTNKFEQNLHFILCFRMVEDGYVRQSKEDIVLLKLEN